MESNKKKDGNHKVKVCLVESVTDQDIIAKAVRHKREAGQQRVA